MEEKKEITIKDESRENSGESSKSGAAETNRKSNPRRKRGYYNKRYRSKSPHGKSENKKLSIVIPLYNEEESLMPLSHEIRKALYDVRYVWEVVFVDDGSKDKSLKVIHEICNKDKRFKFVSFRKNYGKSAALQVGFKHVNGDIVVTMDADLQDDPHEIPNLINKLNEGFDVVSGWKKKRMDPFIKRKSSKFFNFITRMMSGIKIHDFNCGLKAYKREVVDSIKVYGELHRYMPVLADWQGYTVSEIEVMHHPRRYGKTKFGISRFFKGFIDLITVIFTTRYIKRPMHLFGFLGALSFLVGLVVSIYLTIDWINGHYLSNRPMLFLGMLLIIVGVQFFSVGLLGEMMVNNFMDEKEYEIKEKG